jgi:hypothetical protein
VGTRSLTILESLTQRDEARVADHRRGAHRAMIPVWAIVVEHFLVSAALAFPLFWLIDLLYGTLI